MNNYTKEIRETLENHLEVIMMYTLGSRKDEYDEPYRDVYRYEFEEYLSKIVNDFEELTYYQQFKLTVENIKFLLEFEMTGITSDPHEHKNPIEMEALAMKLFEIYKRKVDERNEQK